MGGEERRAMQQVNLPAKVGVNVFRRVSVL